MAKVLVEIPDELLPKSADGAISLTELVEILAEKIMKIIDYRQNLKKHGVSKSPYDLSRRDFPGGIRRK